MQPRTLDQVNASLASIYDPQVQSAQSQLNDLPNQVNAEEQGLQAKQTQAFGDILNGARSRGVGVAFGGIPLADQAQYTASTYLPALAQLHTAQKQQQNSLQDAINQINERRATQAQGIYSNEQDLAEKQREFNASLAQQRAAAASAANPTYGSLGGSSGPSFVQQRADKGFNFTDANGNSISAAAYAHATGTNFRDLLTRMAKAGDQGAKQALGFVGNDYGYDPNKVTNQNMAALYNSLVWGTGRTATPYRPLAIGQASGPPIQSAPTANRLQSSGGLQNNNYNPFGFGNPRLQG